MPQHKARELFTDAHEFSYYCNMILKLIQVYIQKFKIFN